MTHQTDKPHLKNPMLNDQLCFAVHSASRALDQLYRPQLDRHGLTYSQYITLMALAEKDGISITLLARKMSLGKATMTPLLRCLEGKGLILRSMEDGNERQKSIRLSEEGLKSLQNSCHVTEKVFARTNLTLKEAGILITLCKKITHAPK